MCHFFFNNNFITFNFIFIPVKTLLGPIDELKVFLLLIFDCCPHALILCTTPSGTVNPISFMIFRTLPVSMSNIFCETWIFPYFSNAMHVYILVKIALLTVGSYWASTYAPKTCFKCFLKSISRLVTILHSGYFL